MKRGVQGRKEEGSLIGILISLSALCDVFIFPVHTDIYFIINTHIYYCLLENVQVASLVQTMSTNPVNGRHIGLSEVKTAGKKGQI